MKPLFIQRKGEAILGRGGISLDNLPVEFQKFYPNESPKYIDPLSLLAALAAGRALEGVGSLAGEEFRGNFAVVLGNGFGALESSLDFDRQALLKGPNTVNPMDFPNTVANAAGSRIGIWLQLKGPNVTLTNGATSFIDAVGFAFEGYNAGLFKRCLAGAVEKVPAFLKPMTGQPGTKSESREGACLLLASEDQEKESLFEVVDFFSVQLKPDLTLPELSPGRWEGLWEGLSWLGYPADTPLEPLFPRKISRTFPDPSVMELGLSGLGSLNAFLAAPQPLGMVGAYSGVDKKVSMIKIKKK